MPINIKQKVQQIMKDLKEKNYKIFKVEENTLFKTQQKKLVALIRECEQMNQEQSKEKL